MNVYFNCNMYYNNIKYCKIDLLNNFLFGKCFINAHTRTM